MNLEVFLKSLNHPSVQPKYIEFAGLKVSLPELEKAFQHLKFTSKKSLRPALKEIDSPLLSLTPSDISSVKKRYGKTDSIEAVKVALSDVLTEPVESVELTAPDFSTKAMAALLPAQDFYGIPNAHLTLLYFGEVADLEAAGIQLPEILDKVTQAAFKIPSQIAEVVGLASFNCQKENACRVALISGSGLMAALDELGNVTTNIPAHRYPVFLPHITLGYTESLDLSQFRHLVGTEVLFDTLLLSYGEQQFKFPLSDNLSGG